MSGVHTHALTVHGHGPIHLLPGHVKLVAMLGFVLAVVVTPPTAVWAFGVHGLVLVGVLVFSEIPILHFMRRLGLEIPFLLFALGLPFLGGGRRIDLAGFALSVEGLWAAWNIAAKATLGLGASIVVVSTTEVTHILQGLRRLRVPMVMVSIAGFMIRYLVVIGEELRRMRIAMTARGYDPEWLGQARALGTAGGALFVRSYERGERVHQAMLARGFTGTMPDLSERAEVGWAWPVALSVPLSGWVVTLAALVT